MKDCLHILLFVFLLSQSSGQTAPPPAQSQSHQRTNETRIVYFRSTGGEWKIVSEEHENVLEKVSEPIEIKYLRLKADQTPDVTPGCLLARWESFLKPDAEGAQSENASAVEFRSRQPSEPDYQRKLFDLRPYQRYHKGQASNPGIANRHLKHLGPRTDSEIRRSHFIFPMIEGRPGSVARNINLMELSAQPIPESTPTFTKTMTAEYNKLKLTLVEFPTTDSEEIRRKVFVFIPPP